MSSKIIFTQALPKPPFYLLRSHHWTKRRIAIYVDLTLHTKPFQCEFQPSCSREHQWIPQRSCMWKEEEANIERKFAYFLTWNGDTFLELHIPNSVNHIQAHFNAISCMIMTWFRKPRNTIIAITKNFNS